VNAGALLARINAIARARGRGRGRCSSSADRSLCQRAAGVTSSAAAQQVAQCASQVDACRATLTHTGGGVNAEQEQEQELLEQSQLSIIIMLCRV
jgi:hypothetical protein